MLAGVKDPFDLVISSTFFVVVVLEAYNFLLNKLNCSCCVNTEGDDGRRGWQIHGRKIVTK